MAAAPPSLDAQLEAAVAAHGSGALERAEQLYRQVLQQQPHATAAANLGALLRAAGREGEAESHYRWALVHCPFDETLLANACNLLRARGQAATTLPLLEEGLKRQPQSYALAKGLALSLHHLGRLEEALALQERLLAEHPEDLELLLDRSACLLKRERPTDALAVLDRAAAVAPDEAQVLAHRIRAHTSLGQLDVAERLQEAAGNGVIEALVVRSARGEWLMACRRWAEADALYAALCQAEPQEPDHWLNRAACLKQQHQPAAAAAVLREGARRAPQRLDLQVALGNVLAEQGRGETVLLLLRAGADAPEATDLQEFNLQFVAAGQRLLPAAELGRRMRAWEQRRQLQPSPLWPDRLRDPDPQRPLRVAYLSPDFGDHPVARFLEPVLEHHDRRQVTVIGVPCSHRRDDFSERLRSHCDGWLELASGSDGAAARALAYLQADVLVELAGCTAFQRLRPLTARPAPIQLSYLGYFASTHLACIDGWIGDRVLFAPGLEAEASGQRLHRLERCYMAYRPEAAPPPLRLAADGRFRFGSFNHIRKLTPACLDLFAAVLRAVPASLLVLKGLGFSEAQERQRIAAALAERGVRAERLELLEPTASQREHLVCYGLVDAALDPVPYGGATTTAEALWMGVPVVALAGEGMVGRLAASVLAGAGLAAEIATSSEEYLARAQALAAAGPRPAEARLALRRRIEASALLDGRGLATSLEQLYRQLWQERPLRQRL